MFFAGKRDCGGRPTCVGINGLACLPWDVEVSHQFLVVGRRNTCILGADFLKSGGMVVDIASSKLSWMTEEAELIVEATSPTVDKFSVLLESYSDIFVNGPSDPLGLTNRAA